MVTDAVSERARPQVSIPYEGRLLVTLFLLALYELGCVTPLPFIHLDLPRDAVANSRFSILALGLVPLAGGFALVELFSVMTSPGRRLRQSGAAGRARLNRAALATSLLLSAVQGMTIAMSMKNLAELSGEETVSRGLVLLTVVTLAAGTAAVFAIGQFLSAYGIGNGFALLVLTEICWSAAVSPSWKMGGFDSSPGPGLGILLVVGLAALLVRFIRTAEDRWIPAFPQSALPVKWNLVVFALLTVLNAFRFHVSPGGSPFLWPVVALISIPLLSWLGFHLFGSRPRLEANLSDPEDFLDELAAALRRRTVAATALLALGTAALLAWNRYQPHTFAEAFSFLSLIALVAIVLDLWDQFRFQRRIGPTALLAQLDNVHFSYRLEELLQEAGVEALARGHQFRSLFFFFGALFKIDVLVPVEQLDRARAVMAELETAREIRAF
jgi:hypothetical protein